MGTSARLFHRLIPTGTTRLYLTRNFRHRSSNLHHHHHHPYSASPISSSPQTIYQLSTNPTQKNQRASIFPTPTCCSLSSFSIPIPPPRSNSFPLGFLLPTAFQSFRHYTAHEIGSEPNPNDEVLYRWRKATGPLIDNGPAGITDDRGSTVTVVLLGWLGGQPKHLDKYTNLYIPKGFNVVTFAVPVSNLLRLGLGSTDLEDRIRKLVNDLVVWLMVSDVKQQQRRLIFHAFSNTGWLVFGTILEYLDGRPEILERIKGLIVDSGAGSPLSPKFYLYSTADKLVPYSSVEMFVEEQRMKKGRTVWCFNFETSPHVDHYRNFPELYSSKVSNFVDECLKVSQEIKQQANKP